MGKISGNIDNRKTKLNLFLKVYLHILKFAVLS